MSVEKRRLVVIARSRADTESKRPFDAVSAKTQFISWKRMLIVSLARSNECTLVFIFYHQPHPPPKLYEAINKQHYRKELWRSLRLQMFVRHHVLISQSVTSQQCCDAFAVTDDLTSGATYERAWIVLPRPLYKWLPWLECPADITRTPAQLCPTNAAFWSRCGTHRSEVREL